MHDVKGPDLWICGMWICGLWIHLSQRHVRLSAVIMSKSMKNEFMYFLWPYPYSLRHYLYSTRSVIKRLENMDLVIAYGKHFLVHIILQLGKDHRTSTRSRSHFATY